jgi:hypothetical protein
MGSVQPPYTHLEKRSLFSEYTGNNWFMAIHLVCCPAEAMHNINYMVISKLTSAVELEYNLYNRNTPLNTSRTC